jgi:hypothetical protein
MARQIATTPNKTANADTDAITPVGFRQGRGINLDAAVSDRA